METSLSEELESEASWVRNEGTNERVDLEEFDKCWMKWPARSPFILPMHVLRRIELVIGLVEVVGSFVAQFALQFGDLLGCQRMLPGLGRIEFFGDVPGDGQGLGMRNAMQIHVGQMEGAQLAHARLFTDVQDGRLNVGTIDWTIVDAQHGYL